MVISHQVNESSVGQEISDPNVHILHVGQISGQSIARMDQSTD